MSEENPEPEASAEVDPAAAAVELTKEQFGHALTLDQSLALLKCIKIIVSADGLSGSEISAFDQRMRAIGIPRAIRQRVALFDVASHSIEEILTDFPRSERMIRYFLITAITIAMVDGYSEAEQDAIHRTARTLGVDERYVLALETSERLGAVVRERRDSDLYEHWLQVRHAVLDLPIMRASSE